jgi:hypothetical protein
MFIQVAINELVCPPMLRYPSMVHPGGIAGENDPDHPELPINMTKLPC